MFNLIGNQRRVLLKNEYQFTHKRLANSFSFEKNSNAQKS